MSTVRSELVRRGRLLAWVTIGWNAIEGAVGIVAGLAAGSVALVGFGVDSYVEVFAGSMVLWRLSRERHGHELSTAAERVAARAIAASFLVLAVGVAIESVRRLAAAEPPEESVVGLLLALASLVAMPLLVRAKRRVARGMGSQALMADASETMLCFYLSAVLLAGLLLNAAWGWWWADPLAALVIAAVAAREGLEFWRAEEIDDCC
jgi:divalent metal cation (Fe/Co/Zn/Cd) transporter